MTKETEAIFFRMIMEGVFFWYAGCTEISRLQIILVIVVCRELINIYVLFKIVKPGGTVLTLHGKRDYYPFVMQ